MLVTNSEVVLKVVSTGSDAKLCGGYFCVRHAVYLIVCSQYSKHFVRTFAEPTD